MILHEHTPLNHNSQFITFLHLLISPRKTITYCKKGFATCAICEAVITAPEFYFGHISSLICVILGFVASIIVQIKRTNQRKCLHEQKANKCVQQTVWSRLWNPQGICCIVVRSDR